MSMIFQLPSAEERSTIVSVQDVRERKSTRIGIRNFLLIIYRICFDVSLRDHGFSLGFVVQSLFFAADDADIDGEVFLFDGAFSVIGRGEDDVAFDVAVEVAYA